MEAEQFIALAHRVLLQTALSLRHYSVLLRSTRIQAPQGKDLVFFTDISLVPKTMPGPENNC